MKGVKAKKSSGWKRIDTGIYEVGDGRKRREPFMWRQTIDGVKYCESFSTLKAARAAKASKLAEVKKYGSIAHQFNESDWRELSAAREILEPIGYSVEEAAREIARRHRATRMKVGEHVDAFLSFQASNGTSERQIANLKQMLGPVVSNFSEEFPSSISRQDLMELIEGFKVEGLAPRTILNFRNGWHSFFLYLVDEDAIEEAPTAKIARKHLPKVLSVTQKHPLEVAQVIAVMGYMEERYPQWAFWMALQFFVGMREAESRRFRYEWIRPDTREIVIPGWFMAKDTEKLTQGSKTGDAWMIDKAPANFWSWHAKYGKAEGTVEAPEWSNFRDLLISRGVLPEWPHNCRRDSFCTYHLSAFRDPAQTALILKHRGTDTLWKSYMGCLRSEREARGFFDIFAGFSLFSGTH